MVIKVGYETQITIISVYQPPADHSSDGKDEVYKTSKNIYLQQQQSTNTSSRRPKCQTTNQK